MNVWIDEKVVRWAVAGELLEQEPERLSGEMWGELIDVWAVWPTYPPTETVKRQTEEQKFLQ